MITFAASVAILAVLVATLRLARRRLNLRPFGELRRFNFDHGQKARAALRLSRGRARAGPATAR